MKKALISFLISLLLCARAGAEYWDSADPRIPDCCHDRPGCQVLQTVMLGSFARFDPGDSLNVRVLSAALPRLTAVTEDDFAHFSASFGVETDVIKELYFIALANCLRSDIIVTPIADSIEEQNARTVLSLFLNPEKPDAEILMQAISESFTEEDAQTLSRHAGVSPEFIQYLITKDLPE